MKLLFAAPLSGFPSDPIALGVQASRLHFVMKLFFAAPTSGLPFLPTALLAHVSCATAEPIANTIARSAYIKGFILSSFGVCAHLNIKHCIISSRAGSSRTSCIVKNYQNSTGLPSERGVRNGALVHIHSPSATGPYPSRPQRIVSVSQFWAGVKERGAPVGALFHQGCGAVVTTHGWISDI